MALLPGGHFIPLHWADTSFSTVPLPSLFFLHSPPLSFLPQKGICISNTDVSVLSISPLQLSDTLQGRGDALCREVRLQRLQFTITISKTKTLFISDSFTCTISKPKVHQLKKLEGSKRSLHY